MRRQRLVKILATLGPKTSDHENIKALFMAGADVFRINMSHTSHEAAAALVQAIRNVEEEVGRPIGILADLQGPKLRLGSFKGNSVNLEQGASFTLDSDNHPGSKKRIELPHPEILNSVEEGFSILLDDGKIRLRAEKVHKLNGKTQSVETRVEVGGKLSSKKGVCVPEAVLPLSALSPKDRADLACALDLEVDWLALSFVQRPEDILEANKLVQGRASILAKIERPQAVERIEEILDLADAIMVARGDLGVEMPLERVPGIQKHILRKARKAGKPVVVATQMLESMISSPVPTRAEVSDVATAVYEGADAIMLSAESAVGDYPEESVAIMDKIARQVETDSLYRTIINGQRADPEPTGSDAIAAAARQVAETLRVPAIVCYTSTGSTALRVARERPKTHVVALSPNIRTVRKLALVWGVHCAQTQDAVDLDDMVTRACAWAHHENFANVGQRVIILAGVPLRVPGTTNMLRIAFVGADDVIVD